MVSKAWKELSGEEREVWEEIARKDKTRYEMEKSMYKGPWKVQAKAKFPKDHEAPKRPMSAYLSFSNDKRAMVKAQYPSADSTEISRILAQMWKEASEDERKEHIDKEHVLREEHKADMAEWNRMKELEYQSIRRGREDRAMNASDTSLEPHGCLRSPYESRYAQEPDKSQAHLATSQGNFQPFHGAYYGALPHFYPPAPNNYHPDHYMHHVGYPEYSGAYPFYNGGVYADHQSSYSVPSTATATSGAHPISNAAGVAYDPTSYYNHQQHPVHPGYVTNYLHFGHEYWYPPEGSHDIYPLQPFAASSNYSGTPRDCENQKQEFRESDEPSPLSASRDIFSSSLDDHQTDDETHHTARGDEQQQAHSHR
jgi:high mobility group protein B1